jgi:Protein of unknown function (DUF4232)
MTRRLAALIGLFCLGGSLLAACSSGSPASSSSTSTTKAPASTTSTTKAPASTTSTTATTAPAATTTTGPGGPTQCPTTSLTASIFGSSGAAGTIETTVALTSSATTSCTLGGYPGLQMLNSAGAALTTTVIRGGNYSFTNFPATTVSIAPGQAVYFNMGYSDVPSGSQTSCPLSTSLRVTPPNSFTSLTVAAQLGPCTNGSITVSPVFAATGSAAATRA